MGSISVAVVRGFELPKQGRQMILPGEGAEQQRLNLARSMLLATSIVIGARIGRVALPFSAIDHSRPVVVLSEEEEVPFRLSMFHDRSQ